MLVTKVTATNGLDDLKESKSITLFLKNFGLTKKESTIYMFLAKSGVQKAGDISIRLKMHKAQVYSILKKLQNCGIVEATLEVPMRFIAIPFEKALDLLIKAKKVEARSLEGNKSKLIAHWESIDISRDSPPSERFVFLKGRSKIYSRLLQMIKEAKKEVLMITTSLGLIRSDQTGIFESTMKRNAQFKILTHVSKEYLKDLKNMVESISKNNLKNVELRYANFTTGICPRFVIIDGTDGLFFIPTKEGSSVTANEELGLWTNSGIVTYANTFFEELWHNTTGIDRKLTEIETGIPAEVTTLFKDAQTAYKFLREKMDTAREEITVITSSKGIIRAMDVPLSQLYEKGVKIRIMAPINADNFEIAQHLSQYCQIRHVDNVYSRLVSIDNKHFFQLKTSQPDKETTEPEDSFAPMFYTNDAEPVARMSEMLDALWEKSSNISEIKLEVVTDEASLSETMPFTILGFTPLGLTPLAFTPLDEIIPACLRVQMHIGQTYNRLLSR